MRRRVRMTLLDAMADRNLFDFVNLRIDESATPRFLDVVNIG